MFINDLGSPKGLINIEEISLSFFFKRDRAEFIEEKMVLWSFSFDDMYTPEGVNPKERKGFLNKGESFSL